MDEQKPDPELDWIAKVFRTGGINCAICGQSSGGWNVNHSACEKKAREDIIWALMEMLEISERDRIREREYLGGQVKGLIQMWQEQARIQSDPHSVVATHYLARAMDLQSSFAGWIQRIDGARVIARECIQDFRTRVLKEVPDRRFHEPKEEVTP